MRYFKTVKSGYIMTIGIGNGGIEISEDEYHELYDIFINRPGFDGNIYELRETTLEWEQTGTYAEAEEPTETETEQKAQAYDIIMGVSE